MREDHPIPDGNRAARQWHVEFAGLLLAGLSVAVVFLNASGESIACAPFVWPDVAAVSLLFAFPVSVALNRHIEERVPAWAIVFTSILLIGGVPLSVQYLDRTAAWQSHTILVILRPTIAMAAALGGVALVASLAPARRDTRRRQHGGPLALLLMMLVAIAVPEIYVDSRCQGKEERLRDFLSQNRMAEALAASRELSAIRPDHKIQLASQPDPTELKQVVADLKKHVDDLNEEVTLLQRRKTPAAQLELARRLAQLGRREEALGVALPLAEAHPGEARFPLLLGTIYEHEEDWQSSYQWYSASRNLAAGRPKHPLLAVSLKGMAYSARKLGRYDDAETAYTQLIEVAPTAENDFLLAQFYDVAQQGEKARQYARRAIRKQPDAYRERGESLIEHLITNQFGCFGMFLNESSSHK